MPTAKSDAFDQVLVDELGPVHGRGIANGLGTLLSGIVLAAICWFRPAGRKFGLDALQRAAGAIESGLSKSKKVMRDGGMTQRGTIAATVTALAALSFIWALVIYPCAVTMRFARRRVEVPFILFVSNESNLNGAPRSLLSMLEALDRTRFKPLVVTPETGPLMDAASRLNVPALVLPLSRLLQPQLGMTQFYNLCVFAISAPLLLYLLSHVPVKIVHTNSLVVPDGAVIAKLLSVTSIWHLREAPEGTGWASVQRGIMRLFADHIICNSNFTLQIIAGQKNERANATRVYNCVVDRYFDTGQKSRSLVRRRLGVAGADVLVGCVGRVSKDKGQDLLVSAVGELSARYPSLFLVLIGSQADADVVALIQETIAGYGLSDRVVLLGWDDNVPALMSALDIHVTPSRWQEPFGRVAVEAMAAGAVSVVSDRGGLPEIVEDGRSGLVFRAENPNDLTVKLEQVISDGLLRKRLSQAGTQRAREAFCCATTQQAIERIYDSFLNSGSAA